jgi:hypothetical protein
MASKKKNIIVTSKAKQRSDTESNTGVKLAFGKENYKWIMIGILLIVVGMILMIGGFNEDPAVWDESGIYGFRRTVLAPASILAGLAVNVYALFK